MTESQIEKLSDAALETVALYQSNPDTAGRAKAEMTRRQWAHELARDELRWKHDVELSNIEANRMSKQQEFDDWLVKK